MPWLTTGPSRLLRVHHLELGERLVPPSSVLVADPARLGPAERCEGRDVHVLVHPAGPRLELANHLRAALHVPAPHGSAESVVCAVRLLEGVVQLRVPDDRQRRAELLLVDQPYTRPHVRDQGGWIEVARPLEPRATGLDRAAVLLRVVDQSHHALELHLVVDRAELRLGIGAIAHPDLLRTLDKPAEDRLVDLLVHVEPLDGRAHLTRVLEGA